MRRCIFTAFRSCDRTSSDTLESIAEFLEVSVADLLDDYNIFLRDGQARQIKALRDKIEMTQAEFSAHFGITMQQIRSREQCRARMAKKFWEKVFVNLDDLHIIDKSSNAIL